MVLLTNGKFQFMLGLFPTPGKASWGPGIMLFYDGPEEVGRPLAQPLFDLEPVFTMPWANQYSKITEIPKAMTLPNFNRYAANSAYMSYPLDEDLVLDVFKRFETTVLKYDMKANPSVAVLDWRDYRKVASVPPAATAYANRNSHAIFIPDFRWDDPSLDMEMRGEAIGITQYIREELQEANVAARVQADGQKDFTETYANIGVGGSEMKFKSIYGGNLSRLQELKKKYDPDMMWDKWFPIVVE